MNDLAQAIEKALEADAANKEARNAEESLMIATIKSDKAKKKAEAADQAAIKAVEKITTT